MSTVENQPDRLELLVKTCGRYCSRVHHVQTEADLSPAWFREAHAVGITAGTSTPDDVIDRVEGRIRTFGRGRGLEVEAGARARLYRVTDDRVGALSSPNGKTASRRLVSRGPRGV